MPTLEDRDIRQREILPPEKLKALDVTVVGVGAVGRQAAIQLACIGVGTLRLVDFDTVEPANLATQAYLESDLGRPKVEATAELCRTLNSQISIIEVNGRFNRHIDLGDVMFSCVDSISTRELIFDICHDQVPLIVDTRMSAEVLRILMVSDPDDHEYYRSTIFREEEAYEGSCTAKTTIYCANLAAARAVLRMTQWMRGMEPSRDVLINLLSDEVIDQYKESRR